LAPSVIKPKTGHVTIAREDIHPCRAFMKD
jgi:hypothetical protein